MSRWLTDQLDRIRGAGPIVVILDPEELLDPRQVASDHELVEVHDWLALRRVYEQSRHRPHGDRKLLIWVPRSKSLREPRDLPYDIERNSEVVRLRLPVHQRFHRLLMELYDDRSDRAAEILSKTDGDPLAQLVLDLWGVHLPASGQGGRQFETALRLTRDTTVPPSVIALVRNRFEDGLAAAVLEDPPNWVAVQRAWESWLRESTGSEFDSHFQAAAAEVISLLNSGQLRPMEILSDGLPAWAAIGLREPSWEDRAADLLKLQPVLPQEVSGWIQTAEWWGAVRSALSLCSSPMPDLTRNAWDAWELVDEAFRNWLTNELGPLMSRSNAVPLTLDKVGPFLARRLRGRDASRILLVVLDGMGFAQWPLIVKDAAIQVHHVGGAFAMAPTFTPISRQAIFAGSLPASFADTLKSTAHEAKRWAALWEREGVPVSGVRYIRVDGYEHIDVAALEGASVVGMVVTAIDKIVHGAEVVGDMQVSASIAAWLKRGFLSRLLKDACDLGFEVWLTSDHGNIEALPNGRVHEGVIVEQAGVRARWYGTPDLRDAAKPEGITWDPPGLPPNQCFPLFAPGRTGYSSGSIGVAHGGISLDEMIVPLARVAA